MPVMGAMHVGPHHEAIGLTLREMPAMQVPYPQLVVLFMSRSMPSWAPLARDEPVRRLCSLSLLGSSIFGTRIATSAWRCTARSFGFGWRFGLMAIALPTATALDIVCRASRPPSRCHGAGSARSCCTIHVFRVARVRIRVRDMYEPATDSDPNGLALPSLGNVFCLAAHFRTAPQWTLWRSMASQATVPAQWYGTIPRGMSSNAAGRTPLFSLSSKLDTLRAMSA